MRTHTPHILDEEMLFNMAELFKAFADSTRIKILYLLFEEEHCVGDIVFDVGVSQSAISHQLKLLRQLRLIRSRREGKTVYYALADDHVKTIVNMALEHLEE